MITLTQHPTDKTLIQGFDGAGDLVLHGKLVLGTTTAPPAGSQFPLSLAITWRRGD